MTRVPSSASLDLVSGLRWFVTVVLVLVAVLVAEPPARFSLSPRAAKGILRRAEKRGRELPRHLHEALAALASACPDDDRRTT